MLKIIKRFTSLFLIAIMLIVCVIPASAEASIIGGNTGGGVIPPEDSVVHTYRASEISNELWNALEGIGTAIRSNTIIQAMPVNKNSDALALSVTNIDGSLVTQEVFISYDDNGEAQDVVSVNESGNVELVYGATARTIESAIRVIITYNCYLSVRYGYLCQPIGVQAMYMDSECALESMDIRFWCEGFELTYPGLVDLTTDDYDIYSHCVRLYQSSPTLNRWYSANNPLRTDRVIQLNITAINPTPLYLYYYLVIDGNTVEDHFDYTLSDLGWTLVLD